MAANPYLVLGGVIAAGLDGVQRELRLPPPISIDPALLSDSELRENAIERLPETLAAAADAFADSCLLRDAMGDLLHDSISCVRREEASAAAEVDTALLIELHRWRY
jgi:glutamine synthetase